MPFKLSPQENLLLEALSSGCDERQASIRVGIAAAEIDRVWLRIRQEFDGVSAVSIEGTRLSDAFNRAERRRLQGELWASEARLTSLMDLVPDAILLIDGSTGMIKGVNDQASVIFGYSISELFGASIEMLVEEDSKIAHEALRQKFLTGARRRKVGHHPSLNAIRKNGLAILIDIGLTATGAGDDVLMVCRVTPPSL